MNKKKPVILVTNDDGITSKGIEALVSVARRFGEVVVVAPDSPQSGMGHAITIGQPLRLHRSTIFKNIEAYECSGTPVDSVKLAVDKVIGKRPDICLSGINHGSNSSINVIYSGTMSAAMEAAIEGIPAVGFSYLDYSFDADFTLSKNVVSQVLKSMLNGKLPMQALYNVNIPKVSLADFKGLKVCRQANAKWQENFVERKDPRGERYFWLTGEFKDRDGKHDTDEHALKNGYASIVPVKFDLTNYELLSQISL